MNLSRVALCSLVSALAHAAPLVDGSAPNPPVPAVVAADAPVIDGAIDDACWKDAPVITGFTHDTKPPSEETEVRVLCGADALYFAFRCRDSQPGRLIARQRKRNGKMDDEDVVAVGIDTRYDRKSAYWFSVSPIGTQAEDIPGGSAAKVQWRGDWRAASRIVPDGWTAELAIPYGILRYPRGQRTFGLMFMRRAARQMEESNWPIRTFRYVCDNEACLDGIRLPRAVPRPLVMPYALGAAGSIRSNAGVDVKYTSDRDVTALLTVRPDFATIEDVVQTIDFSYNPRWLADKRPFFTEGGDYFGSYYGFYSRTIGEVDAGMKAFGTVGAWRFAGMAAGRQGEGTSAIGNVRWEPNPTFGAGIEAIARRDEPLYDDDGARTGAKMDNTVLHASANYWKPLAVNGIDVSANYYRSSATGPGGEGHVMGVDFNRYGGDGVREYYLGYAEVSPEYTARLAYLPERGFRNVILSTYDYWQVKKGPIRRVWQYAMLGREGYWDGGLWHREATAIGGVCFRNDTELDLGLTAYDRRRADTSAEAAGALLFRDRIIQPTFSWRASDIYRAGKLNARIGRQAGGPYTYVELSQGVRMTDRVSGSAGVSYVRMRGAVDDINTRRVTLSGLYEFSPERSVALRFIAGADRSASRDAPTDAWDRSRCHLANAFVAFRQELRKGADIFVLAGDPDPAAERIHSQIAVKLVQTL
ncbi:MAG TPA: DUF5916 domain-containing protein [Armatimonadota bacterium]